MAVLPLQSSIKVDIVCDGAVLQEYEDDEDAPNHQTVMKYVEATSGKEFGIRWTVTAPRPRCTILFDCFLDRKRISSKYAGLESFRCLPYTYTEQGAVSFKNGQSFVHKYAFSALIVDNTGECKMHDKLVKDLQGIGEITVKAHFVTNLGVPTTPTQRTEASVKELGKVPEKALKGSSLSHQASLRAPQRTAPHTTMTCEYVDPLKQPFATYTFKYRSRAALQSLLLIPRSPSPVPLEERDVDTLSAEEMRELLRRQRERDAAARAIKQEAGIKRERTHDRGSAFADDASEGEVTVVSAKRRRESFPTTVNENGVEEIDLT